MALEQAPRDGVYITQTFPQVKVVVDAPVQMSRELALLRQATGAASRQDMENLLAVVARETANPADLELSAIDYVEGELRMKGPAVVSGRLKDLPVRLQAAGYLASFDGDSLIVKPNSPEVSP